MIQSRRLFAAVALACLIVGACDKKAAEGNKAAGEVLEGTISDAMIATDQTRSQPPLAPGVEKATDARGEKAKAKPGDEDSESPEADAAPTPESSPAPKPSTSEPAE